MTSTTRSERSISTAGSPSEANLSGSAEPSKANTSPSDPPPLTESGMSSFRYNPSATLISLRPMSSKMCNPCPRTTVTHVSGLYSLRGGGQSKADGPVEKRRREAWRRGDALPVPGRSAHSQRTADAPWRCSPGWPEVGADGQTQANIRSSESRLPGGLPRAAGAAGAAEGGERAFVASDRPCAGDHSQRDKGVALGQQAFQPRLYVRPIHVRPRLRQ